MSREMWPELTLHFDVNVEGNTFIASLNKMALSEWSDNDSNRCTEISKLAETIALGNSQFYLEYKHCDELKNESFVVRSKLFCQKCATNLLEPYGKPNNMNSNPDTRVHDAFGKIQAHWEPCLEERSINSIL